VEEQQEKKKYTPGAMYIALKNNSRQRPIDVLHATSGPGIFTFSTAV
jgi:hypothetical protein